jgi:hypothetical protein
MTPFSIFTNFSQLTWEECNGILKDSANPTEQAKKVAPVALVRATIRHPSKMVLCQRTYLRPGDMGSVQCLSGQCTRLNSQRSKAPGSLKVMQGAKLIPEGAQMLCILSLSPVTPGQQRH